VIVHAAFALWVAVLWSRAQALDAFLLNLAKPILERRLEGTQEVVALMGLVHRYGMRWEPGWNCGGYSTALARTLQLAGYEARLVQVYAQGTWGAHISVEARAAGRWVLLDPLFDLSFRRPDGGLASAADLQRDWPSYARQLPRTYDRSVKYEAFRYTDWDRWPLPLVRIAATPVFGEQATMDFCLRALVLNRYRRMLLGAAALWLGVAGLSFWWWRRQGRPARRALEGPSDPQYFT
jgi:hypothetical protein